MALKQEGGGPWSIDFSVCGQTVSVVIPASEYTQTTRTLRQLLLRFVDGQANDTNAGKNSESTTSSCGAPLSLSLIHI